VASADSGVATFPVEITVEGSPDEFFPGALAEVAVVYEEIADAVTVPAMAVRQVDGQATVTVAEGDDREERAVTTGVTSGASIEIVEGLEPGEQVVVELPSFRDDDSDDGGPTGGPSGGPTGGPLVVQEGP
jgi:macrolide-specific efflux system membrane fusion protein